MNNEDFDANEEEGAVAGDPTTTLLSLDSNTIVMEEQRKKRKESTLISLIDFARGMQAKNISFSMFRRNDCLKVILKENAKSRKLIEELNNERLLYVQRLIKNRKHHKFSIFPLTKDTILKEYNYYHNLYSFFGENDIFTRERNIVNAYEHIAENAVIYETCKNVKTSEAEILNNYLNARYRKFELQKKMLEQFVEFLEKYVHDENTKDFFQFLHDRWHNYSDENVHWCNNILIHCVNYAPSICLAQLHQFVFRCEYTIHDIIEFLFKFCITDLMFQRRTSSILLRYLSLSESVCGNILKDLCSVEMFFAPWYAQKLNGRNEEVDERVEPDGSIEHFDIFFNLHYSDIDPMVALLCYIKKTITDVEKMENLLDNNCANLIKLLKLINFTYWHYDGKSYVDAATNASVELKSERLIGIANTVSSSVDRENFCKYLQRHLVKNIGSLCSKLAMSSNVKLFRENLKNAAIVLEESWKSRVCGMSNKKPISIYFTNYVDCTKQMKNRIMRNLYLQRFELFTPARNTMLVINYNDFRPPQHFRFNEKKRPDIREFTQLSLLNIDDFFQKAISADCIVKLLYFDFLLLDDKSSSTDDLPVKSDEYDENLKSLRERNLKKFHRPRYTIKEFVDITSNCVTFDKKNIDQIFKIPEARQFLLMNLNMGNFFNRKILNDFTELTEVYLNYTNDSVKYLIGDLETCVTYNGKIIETVKSFNVDDERTKLLLKHLNEKIYESRIKKKKTKSPSEEATGDVPTSTPTTYSEKCNFLFNSEIDSLRSEIEQYRKMHVVLNFDKNFSDTLDEATTLEDAAVATTMYVTKMKDCDNDAKNVYSYDIIRQFIQRKSLKKFLYEASRKKISIDSLGLTERELTTIAKVLIFLLIRERQKVDWLREKEIYIADEDDEDTEGNFMYDLLRKSDIVLNALRRMFPKKYVHSHESSCLSDALACYILKMSKFDTNEEFIGIVSSISLVLVSLYIFSNSQLDIIIFFLTFILSIRYPGSYLHGPLIVQGSSESGKSYFFERLRAMFSSTLTGTINNSTLRNPNKDEINTDLMSMMNSHIVQCDEPEKINHEIIKTIHSPAPMKARNFGSQDPKYLISIAKLVITSNDTIQMKSDEGVLSRLQMVLTFNHRFKPTNDSDQNNTENTGQVQYANTSVSEQFIKRIFPSGMNNEKFLRGLFYLLEYFCQDFATYDDSQYLSADLLTREINSTTNVESSIKEYLDFFSVHRDNIFLHDSQDSDMSNLNVSTSIAINNGGASKVGGNLIGGRGDDEPVKIKIPSSIRENAENLHFTIDSYTILFKTYDILENRSQPMSESAVLNFIKSFLESHCLDIAYRGNLNQSAMRLKERLKINYHHLYDKKKRIFFINFITKIKNLSY